jgi:regulator of replication initiation timing
LQRRRAQNRASQRAYRERKEKRITDLEDELSQAQKREESLIVENQSLQTELRALKAHLAAKGWQDDVTALESAGLSTPCQQLSISAIRFQPTTHRYQHPHDHQQLQQQLLLQQQQQHQQQQLQQLQLQQQQPPPGNMIRCWDGYPSGYVVQK